MCSTIVPQMKPRMPVPNKSSFVFRGADSRVKGVVFSTTLRFLNNLLSVYNTGYTQKNGAVSKFNKKLISQLTRAQRTPSTAATVQVSHALPAVRFSCLLQDRGASFQDGVAAGKRFLCAPF